MLCRRRLGRRLSRHRRGVASTDHEKRLFVEYEQSEVSGGGGGGDGETMRAEEAYLADHGRKRSDFWLVSSRLSPVLCGLRLAACASHFHHQTPKSDARSLVVAREMRRDPGGDLMQMAVARAADAA